MFTAFSVYFWPTVQQDNFDILCRLNSSWWVGLSCPYQLIIVIISSEIFMMLYRVTLLQMLRRLFVIQNIVLSDVLVWRLRRKYHRTIRCCFLLSCFHLKNICFFPTFLRKIMINLNHDMIFFSFAILGDLIIAWALICARCYLMDVPA